MMQKICHPLEVRGLKNHCSFDGSMTSELNQLLSPLVTSKYILYFFMAMYFFNIPFLLLSSAELVQFPLYVNPRWFIARYMLKPRSLWNARNMYKYNQVNLSTKLIKFSDHPQLLRPPGLLQIPCMLCQIPSSLRQPRTKRLVQHKNLIIWHWNPQRDQVFKMSWGSRGLHPRRTMDSVTLSFMFSNWWQPNFSLLETINCWQNTFSLRRFQQSTSNKLSTKTI